jgi:uncharacterized zinc-type alcohol dehydrogenase-like protein
MQTKAYAAQSATTPLAPHAIDRREPGAKDVAIDILFCGVCHSDLHTARSEWPGTRYPCVPGHEIVGRVTAVGGGVSKVAVGDLVGVGCMVDSCRTCESCEDGLEQYCEGEYSFTGTYNGFAKGGGENTHGGYSAAITVDEHFVLKIRHGEKDLAAVAPLLCAGITTWSPLRHWKVGPGKKVGVVGIGGLGHMGVKLAHAMGAEVSVLSQSLKKMDDGLRLGADHYYATSDPATFETLGDSFDLIVNTVSAVIDLDAYLSLLAPDGTLVNVGAPSEPLPVRVFSLLPRRRSFAGSAIGGVAETQEMLDFCAEHGLGAEVEVIPAGQINEAYERVLASDVRYRFVIDNSTLS